MPLNQKKKEEKQKSSLSRKIEKKNAQRERFSYRQQLNAKQLKEPSETERWKGKKKKKKRRKKSQVVIMAYQK